MNEDLKEQPLSVLRCLGIFSDVHLLQSQVSDSHATCLLTGGSGFLCGKPPTAQKTLTSFTNRKGDSKK
jgi:hypothetical protein